MSRHGIHTCAAPGCVQQISTACLMCREHWFMVPPAIRRAVNESWSIAPDFRALENPEYMAARQAAINAVQEQLAKRR